FVRHPLSPHRDARALGLASCSNSHEPTRKKFFRGRALLSGGRGRRFKSSHSDQHFRFKSATYIALRRVPCRSAFPPEAPRKPRAEIHIYLATNGGSSPRHPHAGPLLA